MIEIKLPDEIKTCLSRDWYLINNENKVKNFLSLLPKKKTKLTLF